MHHLLKTFGGWRDRQLPDGTVMWTAITTYMPPAQSCPRPRLYPAGLHPAGYHCEVHHDPPWAEGGRTDADCLFFSCGPDHTLLSKGLLQTKITDTARLAWTDATGPPEINPAHHPDELLAELYDDDQKD